MVLGVGDCLTDDWQARALGKRQETVELAETLRRAWAMTALLRPPVAGRTPVHRRSPESGGDDQDASLVEQPAGEAS